MPIQNIASVEKYNFEKKGLKENSEIYQYDGNYFYMLNNFKNIKKLFEIKRYLIKDNFNIKINNYYQNNDSITSFLNLDNKVIYSDFKENPGYKNRVEEEQYFFYHHSVLDEMLFKNISAITSGLDVIQNSNKKSIYGTLLKEDSSYKKKFITDFDHVIELRSIKNLSFNILNPESVVPKGNNNSPYIKRLGSTNFNLGIDYNHIFIKPIKPDRLKTTSTIAEVYSYNDDNTPINFDLKIPEGKVKTTSTNKELETYFEDYQDPRKKLETDSKAIFKGYIKINDPTYYDYKAKKTVVGTLHGANFGDTIPFNFKGDYSWIVKSSFNSAFKDVSMTFTTNYKKPLLDKNEGSIILELNESNEKPTLEPELKTIESKKVKLIRNNDYSLGGIKRLIHD